MIPSSLDPITLFSYRHRRTDLEHFDQEGFNDAVATEDYPRAVTILDTLEFPQMRLTVLDRCQNKYPPFLLAERVFAIVTSDPSILNVYTVAIPLLHVHFAIIQSDLDGYLPVSPEKARLQEKITPLLEPNLQRLDWIMSAKDIYRCDTLELTAKLSTLSQLLELKEHTKKKTTEPLWLRRFFPDVITPDKKWEVWRALWPIDSSIEKLSKEILHSHLMLRGCGELKNPMHLSIKRSDPKIVASIKEQNTDGINESDSFEQAVESHDYARALEQIWGEESFEVKLAKLREERFQYTPFILAERAFAEFEASPTLQTFLEISFPLLFFNTMIIHADSSCIQDPTIAALAVAMSSEEFSHLTTLATKAGIPEESIANPEEDPRAAASIIRKSQNYLKKLREEEPSPPLWMQNFGAKGFLKQHPLYTQKPETPLVENWHEGKVDFISLCQEALLHK